MTVPPERKTVLRAAGAPLQLQFQRPREAGQAEEGPWPQPPGVPGAQSEGHLNA